MNDELADLVRLLTMTEPENVEPENLPRKRSRGRPRKGDPYWRYPPQYVLEHGKLHYNLDHPDGDRKKIIEDARREAVSEKVRSAYRSGRNTANHIRRQKKQKMLDLIARKYESTIFNRSLSVSAVAANLHGRQKDLGLSERTLRDYVSRIRKAGKAKSAGN